MDVDSPDRWQRIEALFARALESAPAERRALLESAGEHDPDLRAAVERLLSAHERAGDFLAPLEPARAASLLGTRDQTAAPERVGPYRILRLLGRGGMGVVYLAYDDRLHRHVALKLLPPWLTADEDAARRLVAEARAASALDHPHIITVYDVGRSDDGRVFLAMAYCEGETLRERIGRGRLPPAAALAIAVQVADGLAAAHRRGIAHRDIKPENVLVTTDGLVKIVDFGLARSHGEPLTRPGITPGTVAYMSPEQTRGAPPDPRTDVWSVGVVLYEMLTGLRPFDGPTDAAVVHSIRHDDAPPLRLHQPEIPAALERITATCLARNPADRYEHAGAFLADLAALRAVDATGHGSLRMRIHAVRHAGRRYWRKHRLSTSIAGVVALALAAAWVGKTREPDGFQTVTPSQLAVFPFLPVPAGDSTLQRLGSELVVTLSASLNGAAGMHTLEPTTVLARTQPWNGTDSIEEAAALARAYGAGRVVHGTLVRAGTQVRAAATMLDAATLESQGRVMVSAPASDIAALTDSLTLAFLRAIGGGPDVQAPSPAALSTTSTDALRAYLDGERAVSLGQFALAPEHFARAIAADSTFWFAHWRHHYVRSYTGQAHDSAGWAVVLAHRHEFPEPDRMFIEARLAHGQRQQIARIQELTARYPSYWPAWFELGQLLIAHAHYLGLPHGHIRNALERAAALNPHFVPTWERLLWLEELERDTAAEARILQRLQGLRLDTLRRQEINLNALGYYECLHSLARSGGDFTPECERGVRELTRYRGPRAPEQIALDVPNAGFFRAPLELARLIERSGRASSDMQAAQSWASAVSWAGRGDWGAAMAATERYLRLTSHPRAALWSYGLATVGEWLGFVPQARTAALREAALRTPAARLPTGAAELAWLDGLGAITRADRAGVQHAIDRLRGNDAGSVPGLIESLEAFAGALEGDERSAAQRLAELEWENADRGWHLSFGPAHPFANSVHRLAAGRWLLEAGDTAEAARLLAWHMAVLSGGLHPLPAINVVLGTLALPALADIEEARGRPQLASRYRQLFLERYDRPPQPHRPWVERARARGTAARSP